MGCGKSKGCLVVEERVCSGLGEPEEHLRLRNAWAVVEKQIDSLATKWFLNLFQQAPKTLELFHFKDEVDLKSSKWLRLHAVMSWRVIGRVVKNAEKGEADLSEVQAVAEAHRSLQLNREVLEIAGKCFIAVLAEGLGPTVWDLDLQNSFNSVFEKISAEMLKGIRGDDVPAANIPSQASSKIVQECWALVEQDIENNGIKLIMRLIEIAPDALFHLPFHESGPAPLELPANANIRAEELYSSAAQISKDTVLRGHGRLMLKTFGRVVHSQQDLSVLDAELMAIGRTHAQLNMRAELFSKVGEALLWLLATDCARERWDEEHRAACEGVTQLVTAAMARGAAASTDFQVLCSAGAK